MNGKIVEVYTIEREMREECGLIHRTKTSMTRSGNILRHDWLEVPYLLQINSLVDPSKIDNKKVKIVDPLTSRWNSDVQMMSMYLDKKVQTVIKNSSELRCREMNDLILSLQFRLAKWLSKRNISPITLRSSN